MGTHEVSIPQSPHELRSELDAYVLLEQVRWGQTGPQSCPKCNAAGRQYFLNPQNGADRPTRTGARSARRLWKCGHCRKQYSVLAGTILHGTKISIRTWLLVIAEFHASDSSLSAWQISRKYQVTHETARHMLRRISETTPLPAEGSPGRIAPQALVAALTLTVSGNGTS